MGLSQFQPKKLENWEDQLIFINNNKTPATGRLDHVKQEVSQKSNEYVHSSDEDLLLQQTTTPAGGGWSNFVPVSSATSCITSTAARLGSNTVLDFSYSNSDNIQRNPKPDYSSEVIKRQTS